MEVIRGTGSVPFEKTVVALGNFDGLHKAHMVIVHSCRRYAAKKGLKSGVLLFNEHTLKTIRNESVKIITQEKQKLAILEKAGMDFVYMRDFNEEFMRLSPEDFVKKLVDVLHVRALCAGYDYRFGYKASGDVALLRELGEKMGIEVIITDEIDFDGVPVKSTAIRHFISDGCVEHAATMLGRPFSIEGEVVKGLQNGRRIGIPTANIHYEENMLIPLSGVYAGYTYVNGKRYKSVINVGSNPTFNGGKITIESHILNFNGDLYGKTIKVEFKKRLRGDRKFKNTDALVNQIKIDTFFARKELV